jgi:hypothetical protein
MATDQGKSFSLGEALGDALSTVTRIPLIFRITWPVLAAMLAIAALQVAVFAIYPVSQEELQRSAALFRRTMTINIVFGIAYFMAQIAMSVVVARAYLSVTPLWHWPDYGWSVARTIGLILLSVLTGVVIAFVVILPAELLLRGLGIESAAPRVMLIIGLAVTVFYLASRVSTWVISRGVGHPQTLSESWNATRGAGFKILAGLIVLVLIFFVIVIALTAASAFLLYLLNQLPTPEQPFTVGYFVFALIQFVLGVILSAVGTVYIANVLKQTQA